MARMRTTQSIDAKIAEAEEKLRKLKERCDKASAELDKLYEEKEAAEREELLAAIASSNKSKAEIFAFLSSK